MAILSIDSAIRTGRRILATGNGLRPVVAVLLLAATVLMQAQPAPSREYQIKAVFLFNFTQFVEWPAAAFPTPRSPLIIGILGKDPFGTLLDEVVQGESAGTHPLVVQRFPSLEEIGLCHILYISDSESRHLGPITARLKGRAILTVSDAEGAARRGVMISLFTENSRVRLRINVEAAQAAGLVLSSKLLRPAEIVTGRNDPP
jgi:hypothetical protein